MFGEWFDNRGTSRVINRRPRIGESSRMRDRSVSRAMNTRGRSKGSKLSFFENIKLHREKHQFLRFFAKIAKTKKLFLPPKYLAFRESVTFLRP